MDREILLVRPYGDSEKEKTLEKRLHACGWNTGNIVWYEGVKESIVYNHELKGDSLLNGSREEKSLESICREHSEVTYIFPMANHLCLGHPALESIAEEFLIYDSCRPVILGLGMNLTAEVNTPRKLVDLLPQKRIKALREIGERSVSLGIRGEITAECLELIGVHNYRIIGCPSFYSVPKTIYKVCDGKNDTDRKLNINLSAYGKTGISHFLNLLENNGKLYQSLYSMQDMQDFPKTVYENMPILDRHMKERFPKINMSAERFTQYVRHNGRIFFDINEWKSFLINEGVGYSIGARFHGNMLALLTGIPSIWITHDARTTELCETMGLPHIDIEVMEKIKYFEDIFQYSNYGERFKRNYERKLREYVYFLNENGLAYKESL